MIRVKAYIKQIDYNAMVELLMPNIVKWLSEKDNLFYDIVTNIISKKGKPSKFSRLIISMLPNKTDMAASILPHFDDVLIEYLNNLLVKKNITARITSINTDTLERSHETMLKIELKVDDIDYEKTVDHLLPQILQSLSQKDDKSGRVANLLMGLNELPNKVVKAAIGAIPAEQRDELIANILSEYKEELADTLNSIITKNNIKAEISEVNIDSY